MRTLQLKVIAPSFTLAFYCANVFAHDDLAGRAKEFRYGYQVGYVTAIRDSREGSVMCTKDVPLLETIQAIGTYSKARGVPSEQVFSAKNITEALSAKYKCRAR